MVRVSSKQNTHCPRQFEGVEGQILSRPTLETNKRKHILKIDGPGEVKRRTHQREPVTRVGALMWLEIGLAGSVGFDGVSHLACPFQVVSWPPDEGVGHHGF